MFVNIVMTFIWFFLNMLLYCMSATDEGPSDFLTLFVTIRRYVRYTVSCVVPVDIYES